MKKKETRSYILFFITSGMWMIIFCGNLSNDYISDWVIVLQFLNIVIFFAAGIVNRNRYKKRNSEDDSNK